MRHIILSLVFALMSLPLHAREVALNPDHPQHYVVKSGDTLWDISGRFLTHPWHWPDIWYVNPQVKNPHLIYPGDTLSLVYRDGRPVLELTRGKRQVKLSPSVRETIIDEPIPTIPLSAIRAFLSQPRVVGEEVLQNSPYVVSSADERLISGAGDYVYVRGVFDSDIDDYSVFRGGKAYADPDTGELLGYEAIFSGNGRVVSKGDPAKFSLTRTNREIQVGDRLMPVESDNLELNFIPRSPDYPLEGKIISVFDGVSQIGQYQIIVLNLGERDGLETGHVLTVMQSGAMIQDDVSGVKDEQVTLPDEQAGESLVFKVYDKVSYAIVMKATKAIHLYDKVKNAP